MSGHSKWSKIHRQKSVTDQQRGKIFTKLGRAITISVKEGGGNTDPEINFKLRLAIEKAKQANMPKTNIQKAIDNGLGIGKESNLENITYEGYGPSNVAVMVDVVTDNKNRALSEIKQIFDKAGGSLGKSGSVSYLFDRVGEIMVKPEKNHEKIMLSLMEITDIIDLEQSENGIIIYTNPQILNNLQNKLKTQKLPVVQSEQILKPKITKQLTDKQMETVSQFINKLEDSDEVHNVWHDVNL